MIYFLTWFVCTTGQVEHDGIVLPSPPLNLSQNISVCRMLVLCALGAQVILAMLPISWVPGLVGRPVLRGEQTLYVIPPPS